MLDISVLSGSVKNWKGDALLVLMNEEDCKKCSLASPYDTYVKTLVKRKDFEGKKGSLVKVPLFEGDVKNLYLAGMGKAEDYTSALLRDMLAYGLRKIAREQNKSVLLLSEKTGAEADFILGEAAGLCDYTFDKYKKKEEKRKERLYPSRGSRPKNRHKNRLHRAEFRLRSKNGKGTSQRAR